MIHFPKSAIAPRLSGTYALVLESLSDAQLQVGRRGILLIHPGFYVYVGSAFGSGGLQARLSHHLGPALRPHWHIDYLRRKAKLVAVWYRCGRTRREHTWARALRNVPGSSVPLRGFGSSDCKCESHLFFFPSLPALHSLGARLLQGLDRIGEAQADLR